MSNQIGSDNRDHTIHIDLLLFNVHVFLKVVTERTTKRTTEKQQKEQQKKQHPMGAGRKVNNSSHYHRDRKLCFVYSYRFLNNLLFQKI